MKPRADQEPKISEYHKLEIVEVFTNIRENTNLRLQTFSFLGTAHLVVIGLALTNKKISILVIAILILIVLIGVDKIRKRTQAAFEYRGLQLEDKYAPDPETALVHLSTSVTPNSRQWTKALNDVTHQELLSDKINALRKVPLGMAGTVVIPLIITLEIGIGVGLWFSGWSL